jgi:hypothetical protein
MLLLQQKTCGFHVNKKLNYAPSPSQDKPKHLSEEVTMLAKSRQNAILLLILLLAFTYRIALLTINTYPPGSDMGLHESVIKSIEAGAGFFQTSTTWAAESLQPTLAFTSSLSQ